MLSAIKKFALAIITCFAFSSASFAQTDNSDKVLKVGCEAAFAPFTYTDENGNLVGFDLDLIRAIGKALGYKDVQIQAYPFDGLIPTILTNSIDVIISGFTITPERAMRVDFSDPYYRCGLTYLISRDNAKKFDNYDKLNGQELCVQIGTSGALFVEKILNKAKIKQFNSPPETYLELQNNGCIAAINDTPVNDFFLNKSKPKDIVSINIEKDEYEYYGMAVSKGNKEMLEQLNRGLKLVQESGEFERISKQWFGYDVSKDL